MGSSTSDRPMSRSQGDLPHFLGPPTSRGIRLNESELMQGFGPFVWSHQGFLSLPQSNGGRLLVRPGLIISVVDGDEPGHRCDVLWNTRDGETFMTSVDVCAEDVVGGIEMMKGGRR